MLIVSGDCEHPIISSKRFMEMIAGVLVWATDEFDRRQVEQIASKQPGLCWI